jgi:hypothetical protein
MLHCASIRFPSLDGSSASLDGSSAYLMTAGRCDDHRFSLLGVVSISGW